MTTASATYSASHPIPSHLQKPSGGSLPIPDLYESFREIFGFREMNRSRAARSSSKAPSESSASSSPERAADDDTDFFAQQNDSQSSLGVGTFRESIESNESNLLLPPIGQLPPEILISIFSKLNSPSDVLHCMLVCRKWAANSVGILWHRPSCNRAENLRSIVTSVGKRDSFFPYSELIRRLNLTSLSLNITDTELSAFSHCKRIERLTLTNCSKLTDHGVSNLVEGNRHLQALDVSELHALTDNTLYTVARNCPRLQGLNITGCVQISDEPLVVISEACKHLKRVSLNEFIIMLRIWLTRNLQLMRSFCSLN